MPDAPIHWFHSFVLPDGRRFEGHRPIARLEAEADLVFSEPVAGKTVLDIGAWDGYFSFEAERRGARLVHATDHFCWSGPGWGTKAGFDHIRALTGSKVLSTDIDVFEITPDRLGTFDVVLFLGVLYHLKDPLGGLEVVARMTDEMAVIETEVDALHVAEPVMRFYLGTELNNDPTNYWAPNVVCLENMLREVGFKRFKVSSVDPIPPEAQRWRVVVHCWR